MVNIFQVSPLSFIIIIIFALIKIHFTQLEAEISASNFIGGITHFLIMERGKVRKRKPKWVSGEVFLVPSALKATYFCRPDFLQAVDWDIFSASRCHQYLKMSFKKKKTHIHLLSFKKKVII